MQYKVVYAGSADEFEKELNRAALHDWRFTSMDVAKQSDGTIFYIAVMQKPAA